MPSHRPFVNGVPLLVQAQPQRHQQHRHLRHQRHLLLLQGDRLLPLRIVQKLWT